MASEAGISPYLFAMKALASKPHVRPSTLLVNVSNDAFGDTLATSASRNTRMRLRRVVAPQRTQGHRHRRPMGDSCSLASVRAQHFDCYGATQNGVTPTLVGRHTADCAGFALLTRIAADAGSTWKVVETWAELRCFGVRFLQRFCPVVRRWWSR